jgi:hypothetical protein
MEWLQYTGRWGEIGWLPNCNNKLLSFCGTYGPAMVEEWPEGGPLAGDDPYDHGWRFVNAEVQGPPNCKPEWLSCHLKGSWYYPFNKVIDAVNDAPNGGTIIIFPGIYSAIGTYSKAVTLQAPEGNVVLEE